MLNLIRMNNYRVRHMTCMYVLAVIIGIFAIFSVSTISMTADEMASGEYVPYESMGEAMEAGWNDAEAEAEAEKLGLTTEEENSAAYEAGYEVGQEISIHLGFASEQPIRPDGTVASYLEYFYEDATSGILLIFMTIAVVLFFNREQNSGFIKNIASKSTSRVSIYFSKLVAMILYILLSFVILAVVEYVCLMFYYDGDLTFGTDILESFAPKMGIVILLHIAFITGVAMITTITKSSTMGITIGILASAGFSTFIVMPIRAWFDFDISKYLINYNITRVNLNSDSDVLTNALLVGIITIIVYNVIGCTYFAKKDIA